MVNKDHDGAEMRSIGQRLLDGVDLSTVRQIDAHEARRISIDVKAGKPILWHNALALALWAAKGGMMPI